MLEKFSLFVSFYEAGEDMTDEEFGVYMRTLQRYAFEDIEPDYSSLPPLIKAALRTAIASVASLKKDTKNGEKGGRPTKEEIEMRKAQEKGVLEKNNPPFVPPFENSKTNMNMNLKEKEKNEYEGEEEKETVVFSPQPAPLVLPENYATEVFNLYTEAGLPNCQGNFIFFLQRDFKFALEILHTKPDLRGLHSDMVLGAIKNYIAVLNNPDTWKGWKNKKSFDSFVSWERFKDFLPDRFCLDNFLEHTATPPPQTQTKGVGREEALRILHEELANGKKNSS